MKKAVLVALLVSGSVFLAACTHKDGEDTAPTPTPEATGEPVIQTTDEAFDEIASPDDDLIEPETLDSSEVEADQVLVALDMQARLKDVTGGSASGVALAGFEEDLFLLKATFSDLPTPKADAFYEGWLVRNDPKSVISTGKLEIEDGEYVNEFMSGDDLTDHRQYILTIEPDDGDPAPAKHILEGTFQLVN